MPPLSRIRFAAVVAALLLAASSFQMSVAASTRDQDIPRAQRTQSAAAHTDVDSAVDGPAVLREAAVSLADSQPGAKVKVRGAQTVSYAILQSLTDAAEQKKKNMVFYADTLDATGSTVQGRLCIPINPEHLSGTGSVRLGVYTESARTAQTRKTFEGHFSNQIRVVRLEQPGSYGGRVKVAAKVDFGGMQQDRLHFYLFTPTANTYKEIDSPDYYFDGKNYLHFHTYAGGDVVISDKALQPR